MMANFLGEGRLGAAVALERGGRVGTAVMVGPLESPQKIWTLGRAYALGFAHRGDTLVLVNPSELRLIVVRP